MTEGARRRGATPDPRERLRARIAALLTSPTPGADAILSDLWAFQTARCPAMAAHARAHGLPVGTPLPPGRAVPLPTAAFRHGDLVTWDVAAVPPVAEFRSSGTGSGARPSRHRLRSVQLYEAALLSGFHRHVPELRRSSHRIVSLLPDRRRWPHSSLVHMFDTLMEVFDREAGVHAADAEGRPDPGRVASAVAAAGREGLPVLLLGAAFSHVALLDGRPDLDLRLPEGSLVLETGGHKGRCREVGRDELLAMLTARYALAPPAILSEYGMAELGSQAWGRAGSAGAIFPGPPVLRFPGWVRTEVVDPDTGHRLPDGEIGALRVFDPVNLDTCAFLQTSDLAARVRGGFQLHGRFIRAEARGCSLLVPDPAPARQGRVPSTAQAPWRPERHLPAARAPGDRIEALAAAWAALEGTLASAGRPECRRLADAAGLSEAQVAEAARREAARWTAQRMREVVSREVAPFETARLRPRAVGAAVVIPASTVPLAGLESVTAALLCGAPVAVRPSGRNPVELRLFRSALAERDPGLAARLHPIDAGDPAAAAAAVGRAETVVVHGGAGVVAWIRSHARADARVVVYGPRWSVAVLAAADHRDQDLLEALAADILIHDGLGCLSPRAVLVPGSQDQAAVLADALGRALETACRRLPPHPEVSRRPLGDGDPDAAAAECLRAPRGLAALRRRGSARVLLLGEPTAACPGLPDEPLPMRRATVVAAVDPSVRPEAWLPGPWAEGPSGPGGQDRARPAVALSTLALSPRIRGGALGAAIESAALSLGAARITTPGRMQTPPPGWPHDGQPLLLPFLRLITPG